MASTSSRLAATLFVFCMLATVLGARQAFSAVQSGAGEMLTTTRFSYRLGPGDTPEIGRALAIYGAKYKAVLWLAAKLADKGLLKHYADRQMEIYCLVADELTYTIVDESSDQTTDQCSIEIEIRGALADFVKAEIKDAQLEKVETAFSWQEEMEPTLLPTLAPGQELSRAYRYIRNEQWRKAIIYIDQLEKKYPHWSDLFFAKGQGFEGMREIEQAMRAYLKACEQGCHQACGKFKALAAEE